MTSMWGVEHTHRTMTHVGNRAGLEGGGADDELRSSPSVLWMNHGACSAVAALEGSSLQSTMRNLSWLAHLLWLTILLFDLGDAVLPKKVCR